MLITLPTSTLLRADAARAAVGSRPFGGRVA